MQLFTHISSSGELTLSMQEKEVPKPKSHEVIVRVEAAPINPSDMFPMFGPANLKEASYDKESLALSAPVDQSMLSKVKSRLDQTLPIGNEGAGTVVEAGDSEAAQALMGKTVAILSGASYSQYCCVPAKSCIVHKQDTSAKQAASSFVNPLTALSMIETMHLEGHSALVHTAAASSLGTMLNKLCLKDNIPLVNIVRKQEQVDLLKKAGAKYICNSSEDSFKDDLYHAIEQTGATLAFDAVGGGKLASHILNAMEMVGSKDASGLNTYGSGDNKQVYIYGGLDMSPTILNRSFGMTWGVGGWLLMRVLSKLDQDRIKALHKRVADEINSTFKLDFSQEITLEEAMQPDVIACYNAKKTGDKYFINPSKS
jgi:NADPH:quinone reductase-like Zn-dependent oxidoreductase